MKSKIAIYLAGSIKKEHAKSNEAYWSEADMLSLKASLNSYELSFLNPAFRTDDLSDQRSVFGRDMLQVFSSDIVFVDAREKRGLGVGAEMMWAKLHQLPIITLAPKNSHYHKTSTTLLGVAVKDWIHPFVESLSDAIVENLQEGAQWIDRFMSDPSLKVKNIASVEAAMHYYCTTQLHTDTPMKELLTKSPELGLRVNNYQDTKACL
ncbi:hypothetical protein ACFLR2_01825 [Chlamydiota bacterium]